MPLHVPTSSSGAFVLLEGVAGDEDDGEADDDDDDVFFTARTPPYGSDAPIYRRAQVLLVPALRPTQSVCCGTTHGLAEPEIIVRGVGLPLLERRGSETLDCFIPFSNPK